MWRNWMLVPALVLVLTLSACGGTASSTEEEAAQGELSEARVEAAGRPLSEEEIISAYDRAVTAYSWFVVSPLPDTGQTVSQDGRIYRRVDGMEELEDLRIYLNGLFAPEVTERLLAIPGTHLNGDADQRLPGNVNITFDGVEAETLLLLLDEAGICASAGSACSAGAVEPSHVLLALGLTPAQAKSTLRLTLDAANTAEEIDTAAAVITACVQRLRDGVR